MIETSDFDTTRAQLTAFLANRAPELSSSPVEFPGELVGAQAQMAQSLQEEAARSSADAIPSDETSTEGLDGWATSYGLSNGAGGYGRRGATAASGMTATLSGALGITYNAGQVALANGVRFILRSNVVLPGIFGNPGTAQAPGTFDADVNDPGSVGPAGNLTVGAVLTLVSPPAQADFTATVTAAPPTLGRSQEEDAELLARLLGKMQRPPNGGTGTDYIGWVEANLDVNGQRIAVPNIVAFGFPNYYGVLSPLVVATLVGSGQARRPTQDHLDALNLAVNGAAGIAGKRPIGQDATVRGPWMPNNRALVVALRYVPAKASYAPDWARNGLGFTVSSFSIAGLPGWATAVGANAVLTLNQLAAPTLKTAIDAGREPRIFGHFVTSGGALLGPIIPQMAPCLAWQDAGAQTSLALFVDNPASWLTWVQANNSIYPGGPVLPRVPQSVIDACDQLGPSRKSGLADRAQFWQDTLGINSVATAAATTVDGDGLTRMIDRCISGSVTIAVGGAGTPGTDDVQAWDNGIDGPELLYIGRVIVAD